LFVLTGEPNQRTKKFDGSESNPGKDIQRKIKTSTMMLESDIGILGKT
jgi:hypothetical protein